MSRTKDCARMIAQYVDSLNDYDIAERTAAVAMLCTASLQAAGIRREKAAAIMRQMILGEEPS